MTTHLLEFCDQLVLLVIHGVAGSFLLNQHLEKAEDKTTVASHSLLFLFVNVVAGCLLLVA